MVFKILVATYTNDVYTLAFDPASGSVKQTSSLTTGFHPSWITAHPEDPTIIYAGLEQEEGKVLALKYDENGVGKIVAEAPTGGHSPCSLLALGGELLIANYMSGSFACIPISTTAPYFLKDKPEVISFTGTGPNKDRQEAAHAHEVYYLQEFEELLVPNLGGDTVERLKKNSSGAWTVHGSIPYPPGSGPRHLAYRDRVLYTLLELSSQVSRSKFPPPSNTIQDLDIKPTMSKPLPQPNDMIAAEILRPKANQTYPTEYIYLSNRNDPSPEGDIISVFSFGDGGSLELVNEFRSGLNHLRGMVFGGQDDKYLIAGGANGGGVKVFERIEGGRSLKLIAADASIEAPTGFLWL